MSQRTTKGHQWQDTSKRSSLTRKSVKSLQGLEDLQKDFNDQKNMTRKYVERLLGPDMTRRPPEDLFWP